jgi:hypothetical protein
VAVKKVLALSKYPSKSSIICFARKQIFRTIRISGTGASKLIDELTLERAEMFILCFITLSATSPLGSGNISCRNNDLLFGKEVTQLLKIPYPTSKIF